MGYLNAWAALLVAAILICCLIDTSIEQILKEQHIFRDQVRNPTILIQWKNSMQSSVSQAALPENTHSNAPQPILFSTQQANYEPSIAESVSRLDIINNSVYNQQFDQKISDLISSNILRFAVNVGQQLNQNSHFSQSEIFSPLSIISALALLLLGAEGKSYQELKQFFGLQYDTQLQNNPSKFHEEFSNMIEDLQRDYLSANGLRLRKKVNWRTVEAKYNIRLSNKNHQQFEHIIKVANGLFTQYGYNINPDYRFVVKSVYQSELEELDFQRAPAQARDFINNWVAKKTYGKIPTIINDNIQRGTNVIMASALYFKAFWENSFFEDATEWDNFYPDGPQQHSIKVQMMATGGVFPFYNALEYDCRILGLPYKGNLTTMYIVQPNQSTRAKLNELQAFLDADKLEDMISKMTLKTALLAFPKMHVVRNINMKNILSRMNVNDIFSSGLSDLSLIGGIAQNYNANINANVNMPSVPPVPSSVPLSTKSKAAPPSAQAMRFPKPQQFTQLLDRFNETPLFTTRFDSSNESSSNLNAEKSTNIYQSDNFSRNNRRSKRDTLNQHIDYNMLKRSALNNLEAQRYMTNNPQKSSFFVEDIVHKVDFNLNEQGTEAAAATLTYLRRSGTDVLFRAETPFLILVRHDPTKLILFYGIINQPEL